MRVEIDKLVCGLSSTWLEGLASYYLSLETEQSVYARTYSLLNMLFSVALKTFKDTLIIHFVHMILLWNFSSNVILK